MKLIISGIFIHLVFMAAIFDMYFKSPIITGLQSLKNERTPPAKRLILIVADGLRAESLYGKNHSDFKYMSMVAPYLSKKVVSSRTAWGISHTRVPTESRPGHVALCAGIYEDPSAIARGWKENPVEFDSVFNESYHTWAWGSPDIIPMFKKSRNVEGHSYSSKEEDFSGRIATRLLDDWVFDHFVQLLERDHAGSELRKLKSDKIIFFLHLLGLDTAGHTHKPGTLKYLDNIGAVDFGLRRVENAVEDFYRDNDTVFIFTADHGMTDWGSHGAGSAHETETPFIAWGAGIKPSINPTNITQADIAPLISTLIGISIPVNSIGVLPTNILDMENEEIAHAIFLNAKQIHAQFEEKRRSTESTSIRFLYKPYTALSPQEVKNIINIIELSLKDRDFKYVIRACKSLIEASIKGIDYYQNYYQRLLLICASATYVGWIGVLLIHLTEPVYENIFVQHAIVGWFGSYLVRPEFYIIIHIISIFAIGLTWILLYVQSLPLMYYVYITLPLYLWCHILENTHEWIPRINDAFSTYKKMFAVIGRCVLYLIGIETLVLSFFQRESLSVTLLIMASWAFILRISYTEKILWMLSCIILAVFPFLPVIGSNFNLFLIAITAVLWILVLFSSLIINYFTPYKNYFFIDRNNMIMAIIQSFLLAIAVFNLYSIDSSMTDKHGLTWYNQCCSWILSGISLYVSICGPNVIIVRLSNIAMGLLIPFILLSVSYEPLFLLVLFLNLLVWLQIEHKLYSPIYRSLSAIQFSCNLKRRSINSSRYVIQVSDFRRGFFIVVYAVLAFFGLGNMASINSFDPMWTRNFVSVFSPFMMTGLILFKTLIPYLVVSCVFRALTTSLQAPVKKMFFIVLVFCDIMGLHFLFLVKNTGSWLEIGTSISHYIIVQTMALFLLLLYVIAIPITNSNILGIKENVPVYSHKVHRR